MKPEKSESAGPSEDERGLLMEEQTTTVAIDFSQRDGIPLVKKVRFIQQRNGSFGTI